jgi:glycosyltransferase involved in cell wall biosynthesis
VARIAFLLPNLTPGGAERVGLTLAQSFVERGHEVDLLVAEKRGALVDQVPAGVRLIDLDAKRIRDVPARLIRYLRERRPDAFQVSLWPLTVAGIIAARLSRVPVRLVVSDHISLSRQFGSETLKLALLKLTTRIFYPLADARVCVSQGSARDLARVSGMPQRTIATIYNPVPAPVAANALPEQSWGGAQARFLSVGTLKEQKNHALLIDAFARVVKELNAKLIIVGDGPLKAMLQRRVDELGLHDQVELAGHVADPAPYYASADIFVLPSDYEGFALVIVEALHHGLGIVSTDCPDGPAEILSNGEFGRLVPVGDATALADAMVAEFKERRDPERQRRRAADFSPGKAADAYLAALLGEDGDEAISQSQAKESADTGD